MSSNLFLASDFPLIAIVLPLMIALIIWRLFNWPSFTLTANSPNGPLSLQSAYRSYLNYTYLSTHELSLMEKSYSRPGLSRSERRLSHTIGYPQKLNRLKQTIKVNAKVTNAITHFARSEFPKHELTEGWGSQMDRSFQWGDLNRVRESLKHFIRDWSEEGALERGTIFEPILEVLRNDRRVAPDGNLKPSVLVPGCGLGRLGWEISEIGYNVTVLEYSYFQTLALRFLLSPEATTHHNQHLIHPYASWFSHQRNNENLFREVTFPDTLPRVKPGKFQLVEEDFMKHRPRRTVSSDNEITQDTGFWFKSNPYQAQKGLYDYVVTLFFIDTSPNILATITHIHALLKPGGTWINLGPLLWTSGAQARIELCLDEILAVSEELGFDFEDVGMSGEKTRTVKCEYTSDRRAMMRWIYQAQFWVAKKVQVVEW